MADWYYAKNGQQQGPVNSAQLKQLAASGQIGPDDLVFREGGTQWVAASTVAGLFASSAPPAPAPAPTPAVSTRAGSPPPSRGKRRDDDDGEFPSDDDDRPRRSPGARGGGGVGDILMFRSFIAPWVIIVFFWMGVVGIVLMMGLSFLNNVMYGIASVIAGPFMVLYLRMGCELMIVQFRNYEAITEIRDEVRKARRSI